MVELGAPEQVTLAAAEGGAGTGGGLGTGDALGDGDGRGLATWLGDGLARGDTSATGVAAWPQPATNSPLITIAIPRRQLMSQA